MSLTEVTTLARSVITNVASWIAVAAIGAAFLMWSDLQQMRGDVENLTTEQARTAKAVEQQQVRYEAITGVLAAQASDVAVLQSALPRIERQLDTILTYIREERSPRAR